MNREQTSQRLRIWAENAHHEAQEADTQDNILNWQGQAQVLGSVSTFLSGPGVQMADEDIWKQIVTERSRALAGWEKAQAGPDAMLYAGVVAGYDTVLTILTDMTGRTWEDISKYTGWVNR